MGINIPLAKRAEQIAKALAKADYGDESVWELYLMEAYEQIRRENTKR